MTDDASFDDPGSQGLSDAQVRARRERDGPNRLPEARPRSLWRIAWGALTQPMFLLLLATAAVYALLGELSDAGMLLLSVLAVGGLSIYQEHRTERVLHALKDLSSPRCTVIRQGRPLRVSSQELVRGDRLVVDEGDRLAADARLVESSGLQVDESLLTGESVPVPKRAGGAAEAAQLHAGSLVVQGDGVAVVSATGAFTALGRIGGSLQQLQPRPSRLQQELKRLVQAVAVLALLTCVIAAAVYTVREGSWTAGLLVGLTLAMSLIPEEFAVVWTVMLALGAWRLAKVQVLTRQPQAIEALGTVTVLCVDKTGTLTHNRMTLVQLADVAQQQGGAADAGRFGPLLQAAALASVRDGIEPMDRAIFSTLGAARDRLAGWTPGPRQGVRDGRPWVSHWWRDPLGQARVMVKGAPEAVLALCGGAAAARRDELLQRAERWSAEGLRVLAVAQGTADAMPPDGGLPAGQGLAPQGLLGFMDPLREEVPAAVTQCHQAGMRVIMITGDSPVTARAIAQRAGLLPVADAPVLTGAQLAALSDLQLQQALREVRVFARVDPAQKLRIVQALQQRGEVVAMTGDGVNDAPALRAADIGVAMGQRGTDVAREAAALVLLDDNFASLVQAVRGGRRIFVNLRKALGYLFAVHVPIVGVSLMPVVMGGPVLLLPLHVVLLELIIDPACSLVFEAEPEPDDCMRVPPRSAQARLFSMADAARALAVGGVALAGVALLQWACRAAGAAPEMLRLASLGGIVAGNLLMLLWFRGLRPDHDHTNLVFHVLLLGISLVWLVLMGVPGVGGVLGLPRELPPAWLMGPGAVLAWAGWQLLGKKR